MEQSPLLDPPVQFMTLADGRRLEWYEYGAPGGKPALYFHGGGSIGWEAGIFHREAVRDGIRLISTNRPGAGGSSLCPGRPVAAYSDDLAELLDRLGVDKVACFGESNGGMVALAVAATMAPRVLGAVPINPTVPWFDPLARSVTPCSAALAYRAMKLTPGLLGRLARGNIGKLRGMKAARLGNPATFDAADLIGPPPGTEPDVGELQWRTLEQGSKRSLTPELKWASSDWGFDYYAIPVPLDFHCGAFDAQAPFALVLAERNPDARFHYFSYGHMGFAHPDARSRIVAKIASYFGR